MDAPKIEMGCNPNGFWSLVMVEPPRQLADEIGPRLADKLAASDAVNAFRQAFARADEARVAHKNAEAEVKRLEDERLALVDNGTTTSRLDKLLVDLGKAKGRETFAAEVMTRSAATMDSLRPAAENAAQTIAKAVLNELRDGLQDKRNQALARIAKKCGADLWEIFDSTNALGQLEFSMNMQPMNPMERLANRALRILNGTDKHGVKVPAKAAA